MIVDLFTDTKSKKAVSRALTAFLHPPAGRSFFLNRPVLKQFYTGIRNRLSVILFVGEGTSKLKTLVLPRIGLWPLARQSRTQV